MSIKLILYCLITPLAMWVISSTNIDRIFKKNSVMQIHLFYFGISLCLSYLLVNFFIDIYGTISLL